MARKGVKVKELAVELGVTSRIIIDRCRQEGIAVQNSITKLPPDIANRVRVWFGVTDGGDREPPKGAK